MTIKSINFNNIGQAGTLPQFIYIDTDNTTAQVTATGFLNKLVAEKFPISEKQMAIVTTQPTPSSTSSSVNLFNITFSAGNWSLTSNSTPLTLANGEIYVGNIFGVATGVTMSGDAIISNTGILTVTDGAITLPKLAPNLQPDSIIVQAGIFQNITAGSPTYAPTLAGVNPITDVMMVQMISQGSPAVSLLTAQITAVNTVEFVFSGNPTDVSLSLVVSRML